MFEIDNRGMKGKQWPLCNLSIWCVRVISKITVMWDAMQLAVLIGWVDEKTYFRGMWCWADGRMGGKWHRNADEAV